MDTQTQRRLRTKRSLQAPSIVRIGLLVSLLCGTATLTGCSAGASPGTVGSLDGNGGVRIACSDEWISVGKVNVQEKVLDAAKVFRVGDQLENGAET